MNVMLGNVVALVCLELIEETFEHSFAHKDPLKLYALPLAIDFKTYVFVHSYTHVVSERRKIKHSTGSNPRSISSEPQLLDANVVSLPTTSAQI